MSFTEKTLKQQITYWPKPTLDVFGEVSTFSTPKVLRGRWEDRSEIFRDSQGNEVGSQAIAFLKDDVDLGGFLFNGVSTATTPPNTAYEIRRVTKIPSLNGRVFERKVWL